MPGFLYFLPTDKRSATDADLKAAGLGYALNGDRGVTSVHTTSGPGGQSGLVVAINGHDGNSIVPAYRPAQQTWRKGAGGKFHVGMQSDQRPGPAELVRSRIYDGEAVRLLDGNEWIVPRCYGALPDRPSTLPQAIDLDEDGETLIGRPHPRFAKLCDEVFRFWQEWSGTGGEGFKPTTGAEQVQLAADGLAVNYRVGRVETVALLALWGTDEVGLVLRALIDADETEAYYAAQSQKKSTSAGE